MQLNKIMLAIAVSTGLFTGLAQAASVTNGGGGQVKFKGSINDSPCSISADTQDQTVPMGSVSAIALSKGVAHKQPFSIKLEDCNVGSPATNNNVTVTFTGSQLGADATLLDFTDGTAKGAGIQIIDTNNAPMTLGTASAVRTLSSGTNSLDFSAMVKAASGAPLASIVPGDFSAVTQFKLAYN